MVTKQRDAQFHSEFGEGGAATLDNKPRVAKVPPTFRPEISTSDESVWQRSWQWIWRSNFKGMLGCLIRYYINLPAVVAAGWNPMDQNSTLSHSLLSTASHGTMPFKYRLRTLWRGRKRFQETLFHFWMIYKSRACRYFCLMCKSSPGVRGLPLQKKQPPLWTVHCTPETEVTHTLSPSTLRCCSLKSIIHRNRHRL